MPSSPAFNALAEPEVEFVNNASMVSAAAANVPAKVTGAAPIAAIIGPTAATLVEVMKLFGSPSVPTSTARAPVPAKAVVTLTKHFEITK